MSIMIKSQRLQVLAVCRCTAVGGNGNIATVRKYILQICLATVVGCLYQIGSYE
jgi:hypothetical protein